MLASGQNPWKDENQEASSVVFAAKAQSEQKFANVANEGKPKGSMLRTPEKIDSEVDGGDDGDEEQEE